MAYISHYLNVRPSFGYTLSRNTVLSMYNLKDLYFHYSSIVIMKNVKNLTIAIVVVVIAIAGIFAYKSKWMSSTQSNTEQADGLFPGKIKVGHLIALDMAPLFVAKEEGFFYKDE